MVTIYWGPLKKSFQVLANLSYHNIIAITLRKIPDNCRGKKSSL